MSKDEFIQGISWKDFIYKIGLPACGVLLSLGTWAGVRIINVEQRVAVIESTRFTSQDAKEMQESFLNPITDNINYRFSVIEKEIAEVKELLKKSIR